MSILALDLGTKMGWALLGAQGNIDSGVERFSRGRGDSEGMIYLRFRSWLVDRALASLTLRDPIASVLYERVDFLVGRQVYAAHAWGGFHAILAAWAAHHDIALRGVAVGTIKKSICGSGRAKKPAIVAAVRARGFRPADHNEADALALALMARPPAPAA